MSIITMTTKSASFAMIQCITEHRKRTTVAPSLPFKTKSHRSRDRRVKAKVRAKTKAKTKAKDKAQVKAKAANSRSQPNRNLSLSMTLKCISSSTMKRPMLTIVAGSTR